MKERVFGRTGWRVGEVGYGMWGLAGWTGSDDDESLQSLQLAIDLGCNFFDTAAAYGDGRSERILGQVLRANSDKTLYSATKSPPKNQTWPSQRGFQLDDVFPPDHIREFAERSLANLGTAQIDLLQFHVWEDDWADDDRWQRAVDDLKREGIVRAVGVSINRWEPENALRTVRSGVIDSVQVIYNIFDQAPEDRLFPLCRELGVAVSLGPVLWALLHVTRSATATWGGALSDRRGRRFAIVSGWLVYAVTYAGFAAARAPWQAWLLFAMYGTYYGLTEGAQKALVVDLVPSEWRGRALGALQMAIGLAVLPASVLFGLAYKRWGAGAAFSIGAGLALAASLLVPAAPPNVPRSDTART
jgi:aryl-alcohol dehydrogenase-like predicted oxidoreductase